MPPQAAASRSRGAKRPRGAAPGRGRGRAAPPPAAPDSSGDDVSDDDLAFVAAHGARLKFLDDVVAEADADAAAPPPRGAGMQPPPVSPAPSDDDAGADYERAPRRRLAEAGAGEGDRPPALPVKTPAGLVVPPGSAAAAAAALAAAMRVPGVVVVDEGGVEEEEDGEGDESDGSPAVSESWAIDSGADTGEEEEGGDADAPATPTRPTRAPAAPEDPAAARARVAAAATAALASPDDALPHIKALVADAASADAGVARIGLLSAAAVFCDVAPGYRIRPAAPTEEAAILSKEVRALRNKEAGLLASYQAFLKAALAAADRGRAAARGDAPADAGRRAAGRAAVRALGEVLVRLPHFNHAGDVLRALTPRAADADAAVATAARTALTALFRDGRDAASARLRRDGAQLLAEVVAKKKCRCDPGVLAPLAALAVVPPTILPGATALPGHKLGRKATVRAAKAARVARAKDPVAAARAAAAPTPDAAEASLLASQTTEAVFEAYFRVIKHALATEMLRPGSAGAPLTAADVAARCPLLLPALAALAAAVPGLSAEYLPDLHSCLTRLLASPRAPACVRGAALSLAAASLAGVGDALTVDRGVLHAALFAALADLPLAAATDGCGGLSDGGPSAPALVAAAEALLVDGGRCLDAGAAAALAKRAAGAALLAAGSPTGGGAALGCLAVVDKMVRRSRALRFAARAGGADDASSTRPSIAEADSDDGGGCVSFGGGARGAPPHDLPAAARSAPREPLWSWGRSRALPGPTPRRARRRRPWWRNRPTAAPRRARRTSRPAAAAQTPCRAPRLRRAGPRGSRWRRATWRRRGRRWRRG